MLQSLDERGNNLLHVAVQNNLKKMCSLLIKASDKSGGGLETLLNDENHKGMTPLDYADLYKFVPLADWLLGKGAINGDGAR